MTTRFGTEAVRVTPDGVSIVYVTITDDDRFLQNGETGTFWTVNGSLYAGPPVLNFCEADLTLLNGQQFHAFGSMFTFGGVDYFLPSSFSAARITGIANLTPTASLGGTAYTSVQAPLDGGRSLTSTALVLSGGVVTTETVTLYDDDEILNLTAEIGGTPVALLGNSSDNVDFNISDAGSGDTQLVLVRVNYTGPGGAGSFDAIKYINGAKTYYIPRTGTVDPADVATITQEIVRPASLDGAAWSDFGFGLNRVTLSGDGAANLIEGEAINDRLLGLGGADSLLGGLGEDLIKGGGGNDLLFGALHDDTVQGGTGDDTLNGGIGNDKLQGESGDDALSGFFGLDLLFGQSGNDTLSGGNDADTIDGGAGNDILNGGSGDDRLLDGTGKDRVTGAGGADVFVFGTDTHTDTLADFENGTDRIDLGPAFGALTIVTVAAGTVRIDYLGDSLLVKDGIGLLTAADLTAADFV